METTPRRLQLRKELRQNIGSTPKGENLSSSPMLRTWRIRQRASRSILVPSLVLPVLACGSCGGASAYWQGYHTLDSGHNDVLSGCRLSITCAGARTRTDSYAL